MSSHNNEVNRFFKHSYIYAIGNIINRIGAFILLPVYTNYLAIDEYGALEMFYGVSAVIFGFLSIGIAHATLRFYFEYDDDPNRKAVVSTNYIAALAISIFGTILVGTWHRELSVLVFSSDEYSAGIVIILATIVFELSSQICLAYVRAIEKSLFFVYIAMAKLLIQVSLNIYLVMYAHEGVVGILLGNFVAVFLGWVILSVFTLSQCGIKFHFQKLIVIIKYSFPFLLGTITSLVATNVDKFSLNYMDTLGAVGVYMLAMKFSLIVEQLIGEPFSRSYGSFRFSIMKDKNAPIIQADIVKYLLYGAVFFALGVSLFIGELLFWISDEAFWPATSLVPIIMIASIIKIMNYPVQTGILYAKKTKYFFYIGMIVAIASIIGNLTLIPIIGVYGACITLIVVECISLVLMHRQSQKYFKVDYDFSRLLTCAFVAVSIYVVSSLVSVESVFAMIIFKVLLMFIYMGLILKSGFFLNNSEREHVEKFVKENVFRKKHSI